MREVSSTSFIADVAVIYAGHVDYCFIVDFTASKSVIIFLSKSLPKVCNRKLQELQHICSRLHGYCNCLYSTCAFNVIFLVKVNVDDCENCTIFLGPVKGSVFVRDCSNCK